ncbi:MAG: heavy-metal-associated domain-containing protein [bacterium]|nr:heavy-metal-associated domain-containing protein [bacterium]
MQAKLNVEKMKCGGCTSKVEAIAKEFGAAEAKATVEGKDLTITYEGNLDVQELAQKITEGGYPAQPA